MQLDGVSTAALLALVAFAIDRVVSALLFILIYVRVLSDPQRGKGEARIAAERTHKLVYFVVATILVVIVIKMYSSIRILAAMGSTTDAPLLDEFLTGVVLLGGSDRLGEWLSPGAPATAEEESPPPVKVTGTLTLDDRRTAG